MNKHLILLLAALQLAASLARSESLVEPGATVQKLGGDMKYTEGPVWIPKEKKVVFADIPNGKLMQWSEKDGLSVFRECENPNGNVLDMQGRLVTCQHKGRNIVRTEEDGSVKVVADRWDGKRFHSPNDVAVRSDGSIWFTDPAWGLEGQPEIPGCWVFRVDPESGKVEAVVKDMGMPNGIVFSPDETRVYIADTGGHKLNPDPEFQHAPGRIYCYEMNADGTLGKRLFHIDGGSDGLRVDVDGNLYTTQSGGVTIYNPKGEKLEKIDVPEAPSNFCFGGDDYKTLFITARTSLYSIRLKNAGATPPGAKW